MINKRGQERGLLTWVLGILAVVIIGLAVYMFFSRATDLIEISPDKTSARAEACKLALNLNDFCRFTSAGTNAYINCEYTEPNFVASLEDADTEYDCNANTEQNFCNTLKKTSQVNTGKCIIDPGGDSENKFLPKS